MSIFLRNRFQAGEDNNYLIAGNICNAFVVGAIGSLDDFFLVGTEPEQESNYPLLTGNILDSQGDVLFRLVRNMLVINPGACSKIFGDFVGYEIHDAYGVMVFKVKTSFEIPPGSKEKCFVTTLSGSFYNKRGELVLSANSGEPDEKLMVNAPCAFGFRSNFAFSEHMSNEDLNFARFVLGTHGRVHELFTGVHEHEDFTLDGKALIDTKVRDCTIHVYSGSFVLAGAFELGRNHFVLHDDAANLNNLLSLLASQKHRKE